MPISFTERCTPSFLFVSKSRTNRNQFEFVLLDVVTAFLIPEPTYSGPDNVIYFRGLDSLEEELVRDKRTAWLVAFYAVWNPACVNFAPIFAELSGKFNLRNLKFGKIDVGRYPEVGKKFHVNDSSLSKQLPTLVLFKDGKEVMRRPTVDSNFKLIKFAFTEEHVRGAFDLQKLFDGCKSELKVSKVKDRVKDD